MYLLHQVEKIRYEQQEERNFYEKEIKKLNEKIAKMEDLFDDKLITLINNEDENLNEIINGSMMPTIDPEEIQKHFTPELLETETIQEIVLCTKLLKERFSSQETFYCKICNNIVVNVTQCNSCETLYCKKCIDYRIKYDENCPICKEVFSAGVVPKITRKILDNFILQCPYMCDAFVKYSGMFSHIKDCNYRGKIFICTHCNDKVLISKQNEEVFEKILMEHIDNCPEKIIDCPNCKISMKRRELFLHLETCEERSIKCEKCFFIYPFKMTLSTVHDDIHCMEIRKLRKNLELFLKKNGI